MSAQGGGGSGNGRRSFEAWKRWRWNYLKRGDGGGGV